MSEGRTEYGEQYRAVEMVDEYHAKTVPVQIVRRHSDGREEPGHTLRETVAYGYTTLEEAVRKAVELHRAGVLVSIDHMPDGRTGHMGGYETMIGPRLLALLAAELGK